MKCPHCLDSVHESWSAIASVNDSVGAYQLFTMACPHCLKVIVKMARPQEEPPGEALLYPRSAMRAASSADVPEQFAIDHREACLVLADSPKASAALSRRCLQNILRDHFLVKHANLSAEMDEVLPKLPSHLADAMDAVRNLGNFGAHPMKDTNTSAIIDVETGEAEWCLQVVEGFFDFCFVQPALLRRLKQELNDKLTAAGKPPMK